MMVMVLVAYAQETVVTGKVRDAQDGKPLPGVSIQLLGTDRGTITDAEGAYRLVCDRPNPTLVFSFVGMRNTELQVGERTILDVQMEPDVRQLAEIVVTGTGVPVDKRNVAFAVDAVKASSLPQVPTASIDQALIGRIPGAQISSVNGTPGAEVSILLRGINTVNRDMQPIIMVDGVQMAATQFSALDPNSIDRVEVVQGAAAATIYGAQGANGVIQVFTKKGKAGKLKIDFSLSSGISELLNVGGVRKSGYHGFETNSKGEVTVAGDTTLLLAQNDTTLLYNGNVGYDLLDPNSKWDKSYGQNLKYNDHLAEFMKQARFHSAGVNVSGGGEKTDFSIGLSSIRQESAFGGSGFNQRTNLLVNVGSEIVRGLHLRSITQLIYNRNTLVPWEKPDFIGSNRVFYSMLNTRPFADFGKKDMDENYGFRYGDAAGINNANPYYQRQYSSSLDNKVDILQNLSLKYEFPKYVDVELLYGINHQERDLRIEIKNQSLNNNAIASDNWLGWNNFNDNAGEITSNYMKRTFQNLKAAANVRLDLEKDFGLGLPLRSTTQVAYDYRSDADSRQEFYALGMPVIPPASSIQGTSFGIWQDDKVEFVTYGYLVNERIEYGELAGISGGFRSDYSSAFGKGSRPFTFPRGDAYFRVSGLDFWNSSGLFRRVLEWKLRVAYGEAGIQPQPFDRYVTLGSKPIGTSNALFIPGAQANPDLDVEVSREFETGTDIFLEGLKGDWLKHGQLSFTYWTRKTDNAIWDVPAPPSAGVDSRKENALGLESNGIQASLSIGVLRSRRLSWNTTVNFSRQESLVSKVVGEQIVVGNRVLKAGSSVGEFYGWMMLHDVDQRKPDGTPFIPPLGAINPATNLPYDTAQTQYAYTVASNGWVVNAESKQVCISPDRYPLGSPNPDFLWSWINDFAFSNFLTVSFQFDGMVGNQLYNQTKQWMYRDGIHADYEMPVTIAGAAGAWSAFYQSTYTPTTWEKSYFVEDASFIRLRSVSIGIDFARLFTIEGIERLQLVLTGRNLLTFTNYSGMDPEASSSSVPNPVYGSPTQSLLRGVDSFGLPNPRTYQLTLNLGF